MISQKVLDKACHRLLEIEGAMKGLGAVFAMAHNDMTFTDRELSGIGELFRILSREAESIGDVLRYGPVEVRVASDNEKNADGED